jgi:hypothetical protein
MKKIWLFALLGVALAACSSSAPQVTAAPTTDNVVIAATATALPATPTTAPAKPTLAPTAVRPTEPVRYGPADFPAGVNPLTGQTVADPSVLNRRPVALKVQLFPRQYRPPTGISQADIVFDYYQNNGMTRLHAIFYGSLPTEVSPIRSARLFDDHLIRMFKSVFGFGGADERIQTRLFSADYANRLLVEGPQNCPPMCRVDPNGANLLGVDTTTVPAWAVTRKIDNERQDLNGFVFDAAAPTGGKPVSQISNHFSISAYSRWDYDPAKGAYLRSQDTAETSATQAEALAPLVDKATNVQISTPNVVVLLVQHDYFYRSKSGDSEIIDILFTGSGKGYAFRDGQMYEITWSRPALTDLVKLTLADGSAYALKPGSTWFEIHGTSSKAEDQGSGVWRFEQSIP